MRWRLRAVAAAVAVVGGAAGTAAAATDAERLERGRYLVGIMDCTGCHTGGALMGQPDPGRFLAGSEIGFEIPGLGVFYPPNLTPDPETGIGQWSEDQIVTALRTGTRPDGRQLVPVMPWRSYAALADEDAGAIAAYLKTLKPVSFRAPAPAGPQQASAPYLSVVLPK